MFVIPRQEIKKKVSKVSNYDGYGHYDGYDYGGYYGRYYGWHGGQEVKTTHERALLPAPKNGDVVIMITPTQEEIDDVLKEIDEKYKTLSSERVAMEELIDSIDSCEYERELTDLAWHFFMLNHVPYASRAWLLDKLLGLIRDSI